MYLYLYTLIGATDLNIFCNAIQLRIPFTIIIEVDCSDLLDKSC